MMPGSQQLVNDMGESYAAVSVDATTERMWVNGQGRALQSGSSSTYSGSRVSFMALNDTGTKAVRGEWRSRVSALLSGLQPADRRAATVTYTLIETAKLNSVDPQT